MAVCGWLASGRGWVTGGTTGPVRSVGELETSGREPSPPGSYDEDMPGQEHVGGQEGHAPGPEGPDLLTDTPQGPWASPRLFLSEGHQGTRRLVREGRSLWDRRNGCSAAEKAYGGC